MSLPQMSPYLHPSEVGKKKKKKIMEISPHKELREDNQSLFLSFELFVKF